MNKLAKLRQRARSAFGRLYGNRYTWGSKLSIGFRAGWVRGHASGFRDARKRDKQRKGLDHG